MIIDKTLENKDFLYCPVEESPYEVTSCTFFNKNGLSTTMHSLKLKLLDYWTINSIKKAKESYGRFLQNFAKKCIQYVAMKIGFSISRKFELCAVTRQFFIFEKDIQLRLTHKRMKETKSTDADIINYWDKTHDIHTQ